MIIRIDYDEPDVSTYRGVILAEGNGGIIFNTGNPVKDFRDALELVNDLAFGRDISCGFSSTCDSFVEHHPHLAWGVDKELDELIVWYPPEYMA